jgi:hypothetical protein
MGELEWTSERADRRDVTTTVTRRSKVAVAAASVVVAIVSVALALSATRSHGPAIGSSRETAAAQMRAQADCDSIAQALVKSATNSSPILNSLEHLVRDAAAAQQMGGGLPGIDLSAMAAGAEAAARHRSATQAQLSQVLEACKGPWPA